MASATVFSNVKVITSNTVPTTSTLKHGEFAFGMIDNVAKLYGNVNGTIIEFGAAITIELIASALSLTTAELNNLVALAKVMTVTDTNITINKQIDAPAFNDIGQ